MNQSPFIQAAATLLAMTLATPCLQAAGNLTDGPDPDLVYDPATGRIWFDASDTESTKLLAYGFGNTTNGFVNRDDARPPFFCLGSQSCDRLPFQHMGTDPLSRGVGPIWYYGRIFPTGMTAVETAAFLLFAEYYSGPAAFGAFDIVIYSAEWDGIPGDGPAADLIYNYRTGNVRLDASDTAIQLFRHFGIGTLAANLRIENLEGPVQSSGPVLYVDRQMIQRAPLSFTDSAVIDLGDIFPTGISDAEQLEAYLSDAWYGASLEPEMGTGEFDLIVVPEPQSSWLLLLCMVVLIRRRHS